ncbi:MAG: hypothetical protein LRY26_00190 [Bacilli bacterium]|nr:hypothetical protein [Bacilli bacterium]
MTTIVFPITLGMIVETQKRTDKEILIQVRNGSQSNKKLITIYVDSILIVSSFEIDSDIDVS